MSLTYKLKTFEKEISDNTFTRIGFIVVDEKNEQFYIDQLVETGKKTQEELTKEAYDLCQNSVNEWVESKKNIGMEWDSLNSKFKYLGNV